MMKIGDKQGLRSQMMNNLRSGLQDQYLTGAVSYIKQRSGTIPLPSQSPGSPDNMATKQMTENNQSQHRTRTFKQSTNEQAPCGRPLLDGDQSNTQKSLDYFSNPKRHRENMKKTLQMMGSNKAQKQGVQRHVSIQDPPGEIIPLDSDGDDGHQVALETSHSHSDSYFSTFDTDCHVTSTGRRRSLARHHKHDKLRQQRLGAKFRRLAKFLTVLFGLWRIHAKKVKQFFEDSVDFLDVGEPMELMFDVTEYRADKQARVSADTKKILMKRSSDRTQEEIRHIQVALGNYDAIAEYPLKMTLHIAEKAWYEKYGAKRVIIKEGHPARCYYFILSGSVVVTKQEQKSGLSKTVCFLGRGEPFGDLGILNNAPRQATVVSRENVELLVFSDEDFVDIFMSGGLKDPRDPFLRSLYYMRDWPIHILEANPHHALMSYFKRGSTLVYDSKLSDWLFIVKSGSCRVLKKLKQTVPHHYTPPKGQPTQPQSEKDHIRLLLTKLGEADEWRDNKRSFMYRKKYIQEMKLGVDLYPVGYKHKNHLVEVRNSRGSVKPYLQTNSIRSHSLATTGPFLTKTDMTFHPPVESSSVLQTVTEVTEGDTPIIMNLSPLIPPLTTQRVQHEEKQVQTEIYKPRRRLSIEKKSLMDEINDSYFMSEHLLTEADKNPLFVRVQTLTKGAVFGLAEMLHPDQPSLSLISNGAECIIIKKKFYMEHVDKQMLDTLQLEVAPYPSDDQLQGFLQNHVNWLFNRKKMVEQIQKENRIAKASVNDARSIPDLRW